MPSMRTLLVALALLSVAGIEGAPFFDAIYDAINGNGRRSYGYSGYGNYGYNGYNGYNGYRHVDRAPRQGKTYKEICRVHFPDSVAVPGAGGIVCPY
ncbi:unnamed protein product [Leptosia nina]|uniref:Uncharacterized protein n=1 Tax=Leptosia nina TaxID=320188 RepID=A0AAV1JUQ7_9NEOP